MAPSPIGSGAPDDLAAHFYGTMLHDAGKFRMWYYADHIGRAARSQGLENRVELHVVPEPRGHTTPDGAIDQAAEWIRRQLMIGIPK